MQKGVLNAKKVAFKMPKFAFKFYEMDPWTEEKFDSKRVLISFPYKYFLSSLRANLNMNIFVVSSIHRVFLYSKLYVKD